MIRLLNHPVRDHCPPRITEDLLEDLALDGLMGCYFEAPEAILTCDPSALRERNQVLRNLRQHPGLLAALDTARNALAALKETAGTLDVDPIRVLASLDCLRGAHTALRGLETALRAAGPEVCPQLHALRQNLSRSMEEAFPPDLDAAWAEYAAGADFPGSVHYKLRFTARAQIESVALQRVERREERRPSWPWQRGTARVKRGKAFALQPDTRGGPGYGYDPKGALGGMQRLKFVLNRLLSVQAAAARPQIRGAALRLHTRYAHLQAELDFFVRACALTPQPPASRERPPRDPAGRLQPGRQDDLPARRGGCSGFFPNGIARARRPSRPLPGLQPGQRLCRRGAHGADLRKAGAGARNRAPGPGADDGGRPGPVQRAHHRHLARGKRALSREILCILLARRQRCLWVTHLFPLFDEAERLGERIGGSTVLCMRTRQDDPNAPPFAVYEGRPAYDSGARRV